MRKTYHYEHISSNNIEELVTKANERAASEGSRLIHFARGFSGHDNNTDYWRGILEKTVNAADRPAPDLGELDEDTQTIYNKLVEVARDRETIGYGPLAREIGRQADELNDVLHSIFWFDHNAARPPIGALVVNVGRIPSRGFFSAARAAQMDVGDDEADERAFWEQCRDKVYEYWTQ